MLVRHSLSRVLAKPQPFQAAAANARNMATLREIELRLKSVRNIEKITKVRLSQIFLFLLPLTQCPQSMKMIASTKLAKAQRAMQAGQEYGIANAGMPSHPFFDTSWRIQPLPEVYDHTKDDKPNSKKLFIVISSDKGLCGGVHSSVSKATRRAIAGAQDSPLGSSATVDKDSPVMVIGDKSKAQLSRALPQNLRLTFNQIGKDVPTFADAAGVADLIVKSNVEYDSVVIVYNKYVSAVSYEATAVELKGQKALTESGTCPNRDHLISSQSKYLFSFSPFSF
jgi:F-type H+-transporting ATPase subunit gamma